MWDAHYIPSYILQSTRMYWGFLSYFFPQNKRDSCFFPKTDISGKKHKSAPSKEYLFIGSYKLALQHSEGRATFLLPRNPDSPVSVSFIWKKINKKSTKCFKKKREESNHRGPWSRDRNLIKWELSARRWLTASFYCGSQFYGNYKPQLFRRLMESRGKKKKKKKRGSRISCQRSVGTHLFTSDWIRTEAQRGNGENKSSAKRRARKRKSEKKNDRQRQYCPMGGKRYWRYLKWFLIIMNLHVYGRIKRRFCPLAKTQFMGLGQQSDLMGGNVSLPLEDVETAVFRAKLLAASLCITEVFPCGSDFHPIASRFFFFRSPKLELLLFSSPPRPWRINCRPSQPRVSSDLSAWTLYTCPLQQLESAIRLRHPMAFSSVLLTSYSRSDTTSVSHDSLEHPGVLLTLSFCRPLIGQQHVDDITLKNTVCVSRNVC